VPPGVNGRKVQAEIAPHKDVEGLNPVNMGMVVFGKPRLGPCTPMGAYELLKSIPMEPSKPIPDFMERVISDLGVPRGFYGKEACVVGHSEIVGKPLALLLVHSFCTVTTCHIGTVNLKEHTRKADILCVAVGKTGLITKDMVQPGAIVIDIGINRVRAVGPDGKPLVDEKTGKTKMKTVGDTDFDNVKDVAGMITPVPGGVGPMTVAMLLRNTVEAAKAMA
jgi:methylenetetrahydrofolate dehydrogenase (NADP+)/methenyltetrahydrofolate cyclohydrolase